MPVQARAIETRQKLIDVAVDLFVENGYLETSLKDITRAAKLTPGAFYYHFQSKEDIAAAIIDQGWPPVGEALATSISEPGSGLENIIETVFAVIEIINRNKVQWIGFHLNQAIGHLSPVARQEYRRRVEAFSELVPSAFRDDEIREGITRREAGELIWIALTGSQLLSDALGESGPELFNRLAMSWRSVLRTIVPTELLPPLEAFVTETAERYGWRTECGDQQSA